MDSGNNSGSLQSSSGGDEEYDSRAAFLSSGPISTPPPPTFFDPLSNYLLLSNNNNPNPTWPRPDPRSDPNPNQNQNNHILNPNMSSNPFAAGPTHTLAPPPPAATAARNPKKRSRASRRAPTTVLTTDTTNFRAMVQEFTGIPSPPFTNSSSFPMSRFDFLGGGGSTRSSSAAAPPYLRRPFAQKIQPPPIPNFLSNDVVIAASSSSTNPAINNYSSNLFQNPLLTTLLQSNPKFPLSNNPPLTATSKPHQNPYQNDNLDEQFGLGHGGFVRSEQNDDVGVNTTSFKGTGEGNNMMESWICSNSE